MKPADEFWIEVDSEFEEPVEAPVWRRGLIMSIAALAVVALAGSQLWNLVDRGAPPIADNGLEICGFDYCVVQDAIRAEGLGAEMTRLASIYVSLDDARALATALTEEMGEDPVTVEMVDRLDGRTAGQYSSSARTIWLERPARAWIVLHEAAHIREGGHGDRFVAVLAELIRNHPEIP
jgi:hypothetical protein